MNVAKKILHTAIGYPSTNPTKNINFISPPPRDSCLNIKSPNFFIKSIVANEPIPDSMQIDVLYKPILTISIKIIAKIAIINTSSNIIMYSISLIIIIIRLDTNIKATISSKVKPNTW